MHKHKVITFREMLLIITISLAFISGGCLPESEQNIDSTIYNTVIIDPMVRYQVIEGYGQGNMEQSTPVWYRKYSDQIEDILDTLYTFKNGGLGINICRYPMPAADAPGHDHMRRLPKYANKPFEYEDGKFNWDGHEDVLWLGQGAAKRGAKMWASWYGFPYWLSTSGCAAGCKDGKSNNLIAGKEARFIKHVVDVIKYFHTNWGIQFDYVNPINEPEADWWEAGGGQPGSKVTYQQSLKLYKEIIKQFAAADLNMDIIAYDAAFTNTTEYLDKFMRSEIKDDIDVLACHQYITSNDAMRRWAQTSKQTGKSLWMTEWGDWTNTKKDIENEVKQMLNYANRLHEAFEVLEANAWVMWEPSFIFNAEDDGLRKRKSYWAIAHYSRHAGEGHQRVSAQYAIKDYKTTAWINKKNNKISIVTVNDSDKNYDVRYDIKGKNAKKSLAFRTDKNNNYQQIEPKTTAGEIVLNIPAKSITTIEIWF